MSIPLGIKLAALAGGALLFLWPSSRDRLPDEPENPKPNPDPAPTPTPPIPPGPAPFPDTQSSATVGARGGLNIRSSPNEGAARLTTAPFNSWLAILDAGQAPGNATPAAPSGWFLVQTEPRFGGVQGWASAEYIIFGTPKERSMTPEEEAEWHRQQAEREHHVETAGVPGMRSSRARLAPVANYRPPAQRYGWGQRR